MLKFLSFVTVFFHSVTVCHYVWGGGWKCLRLRGVLFFKRLFYTIKQSRGVERLCEERTNNVRLSLKVEVRRECLKLLCVLVNQNMMGAWRGKEPIRISVRITLVLLLKKLKIVFNTELLYSE